MPPIERRRRRRRLSRSRAVVLVVVVVVAALVLVTLIGGLLEVKGQSAGYERAVDRSYGAQTRLLVRQSNRLDARFHVLLGSMSRDSRTSLQAALDTLVRSATSVARAATTVESPAPTGGAGADVTAAMADRASAVRTLRTAVDRLLGISPLPVTGAPDPSSAKTPRPLSTAGAAAELARVGVLLRQSDRSYASGRRALREAPGRVRLPSSIWSRRTGALTSQDTLATAEALAASSSLGVVHRVELVTHALALTPAPVPSSAAGTHGVALLPPTGRLALSVVVANDGDVAEQGIAVHASVTQIVGATTTGGQGATGGSGTTGEAPAKAKEKSRHLSLTAHSSATVTVPAIRVVPGNSYTVVVTVDPPLPDVAGTVTSDTLSFRVAPPGPPAVSQLLPASGRKSGGVDVTILGSGFTWVSAVTFGTTAARFKVASSSRITAIAPPGTGTVGVHVTNPGGASAASKGDRFHYHRSRASK